MKNLHKRDTIQPRFQNKKPMKKQNISRSGSRFILRHLKVLGFAVLALVVVSASLTPGFRKVVADATCNSIADCQAQIDTNNNAVAQLQNEAASYQDAINRLGSQITLLQGAIDANTAQQAKLQQQITEAQAEIDHQRTVLAADIKAGYVDGTPSTIEMLASSNDLSDFVDKQEYRTRVQNNIQETLKKIAALQKQLQDQKTQVEVLLKEQAAQKSQLDGAYAEQANLLAYNESQQSAYNAQTAANQSKLQALIAAQRAANLNLSGGYYFLRFPGGVGNFNPGNYPYANAGFGMSTAPGCVDNDGPDQWGYCTRQCVSFTAWAVAASGRDAPYYYGNAKDWVAAAYRRGIPVYTSNPQPGDVAISTAGTWGHAMYVTAVNGNQIYVWQYNAALNGRFSEQWRTWR